MAASDTLTLRVDAARLAEPGKYNAGIKTVAVHPDGIPRSVDIAQLDELSLKRWLRQTGGSNSRAERVVLYALGWRSYQP